MSEFRSELLSHSMGGLYQLPNSHPRVQARSNAEERQLKLVGYYQATDRPEDDRALYPVGQKVASIVREGFESAFAILVSLLIQHLRLIQFS